MSALFARAVAELGEPSPFVYIIDAGDVRTTRILLRFVPDARVVVMNNHARTCAAIARALVAINEFRPPALHVQLRVGDAHDALSAHPADAPMHVYYDATCVALRHATGERFAVERAVRGMQPGGVFALTIAGRCSWRSEAYALGLHTAADRIADHVAMFAGCGAALVQRPYNYKRRANTLDMRWMLFRKTANGSVAPSPDIAAQPLPIVGELAADDTLPDDLDGDDGACVPVVVIYT